MEKSIDTPICFNEPLNIPRPYKSHLYSGWSPKLSRRVTFFDDLILDAWIKIEFTPEYTKFCERPHCAGGKKGRLIDFWIEGQSGQSFILVTKTNRDELLESFLLNYCGFEAWCNTHKINLIVWSEQDIRQSAKLLRNRKIGLQYLSSNAERVPSVLTLRLLEIFTKEGHTTVREAIGLLDGYDPVIVVAALFQLLARGEIKSDELTESLFSMNMAFYIP